MKTEKARERQEMKEGPERKIRGFEDLHTWQACRDLRVFISTVVKALPKDEKYRLVDEMIRSSRAASALIAEGYGRYHFKENIQCCRQSRGEPHELLDHLIVAKDEGFIGESEYEEGRRLTLRAIELVNGYIRFLQTQEASQGKGMARGNARQKTEASDRGERL